MTSLLSLMQQEAAKALELYCSNKPLSLVHLGNARRIAEQIGLSARNQQQEKKQ